MGIAPHWARCQKRRNPSTRRGLCNPIISQVMNVYRRNPSTRRGLCNHAIWLGTEGKEVVTPQRVEVCAILDQESLDQGYEGRNPSTRRGLCNPRSGALVDSSPVVTPQRVEVCAIASLKKPCVSRVFKHVFTNLLEKIIFFPV